MGLKSMHGTYLKDEWKAAANTYLGTTISGESSTLFLSKQIVVVYLLASLRLPQPLPPLRSTRANSPLQWSFLR